ncbi:unnamed protein product [Moneuplotes crassus]|uniref:Uncharacterized protein n=1 Tax=Euplotes crassus TaxID=5936 RepID=A0AAD1UFP1_EUPCR|nr:unnamed protein product [Moneuplotes crassus]
MEKPYFLKRLRKIRLQNISRLKRKEKVEEKFKEIMSKTIDPKEEFNKSHQNGIEEEPKTPLQLNTKRSKVNSPGKSPRRNKKSPSGSKLRTINRPWVFKKSLNAFTSRRSSRDPMHSKSSQRKKKTPKHMCSPEKDPSNNHHGLGTYSRKLRKASMARLLNISCQNPILDKPSQVQALCNKLKRFVKKNKKSRSINFST